MAGYSLSMYGDYLVVGAPGANKAFIFGMTDGAWDTTAVAILDGSTAGATKGFGAPARAPFGRACAGRMR